MLDYTKLLAAGRAGKLPARIHLHELTMTAGNVPPTVKKALRQIMFPKVSSALYDRYARTMEAASYAEQLIQIQGASASTTSPRGAYVLSGQKYNVPATTVRDYHMLFVNDVALTDRIREKKLAKLPEI